MEKEAYSTRMHEAVLHEVQRASIERLAELASYYRRRDGPGRVLVESELRARLARQRINYPTL
jgi:hypothetical protein